MVRVLSGCSPELRKLQNYVFLCELCWRKKTPGTVAAWTLRQAPPSTAMSQDQRATGKGRSNNLEQSFQWKGAYLPWVWHHKWQEGIHRHHPWGDGCSKAFPQERPKGDVLPLLDISCYGKTASLGLTVTYSPALDLHGPLYMAMANQISQGTKRRVLSMKTEVLGGTVLGYYEEYQDNPYKGPEWGKALF